MQPAVRERIRLAIIELMKRKAKLTVRALREEAGCDQNGAATVKRLYEAKRMPPLMQPWDVAVEGERAASESDGPGEIAAATPLGEQIERADTYDDLLRAGKAVAVAVLNGQVDAVVGEKLSKMMAEMRHVLKARASEPPEQVDEILPCTDEARPLLEAFEGIIDDDRRGRVLAYAQREAEVDALENPTVDTGGQQS